MVAFVCGAELRQGIDGADGQRIRIDGRPPFRRYELQAGNKQPHAHQLSFLIEDRPAYAIEANLRIDQVRGSRQIQEARNNHLEVAPAIDNPNCEVSGLNFDRVHNAIHPKPLAVHLSGVQLLQGIRPGSRRRSLAKDRNTGVANDRCEVPRSGHAFQVNPLPQVKVKRVPVGIDVDASRRILHKQGAPL